MKCENCGKNEVSFVYQSNINGKRGGETPLQPTAPGSWAMPSGILAQQRRMMRGMESFFDDSFFGGSLLGDFFGERTALNGRRNRLLRGGPLRRLLPGDAGPWQRRRRQETPKAEEKTVSEEEERSHFAQMRQRNALRHGDEEGHPRGELRAGGRDPR